MDRFKNVNGIVYKLCSKCHQYKPMTTEYFGKTKNADFHHNVSNV